MQHFLPLALVLLAAGCQDQAGSPSQTTSPPDADSEAADSAVSDSQDSASEPGDTPTTPSDTGPEMSPDIAPNPLDDLAIEAALPAWAVVVPARIGAAAAQPFLLDTGAGRLALTPAVAAGVGGTSVPVLVLGNRTYTDVPFMQHDLATVSGLLGVPLAGNLGHDLLADRVVAIDYRRGRVYPLEAWSDALDFGPHVTPPFAAAPLEVVAGHVLIASARFEALAEDTPVVIDTGTNSGLITQSLADALGVATDGRKVLVGSSAIGGGLTVDSDIVRIRACAIGGQSSRLLWASIVPDFYLATIAPGVNAKAVLGGAFLREFLVAIDYPAQRLRLAPYASLDHIFDQFRAVGIEVIAEGGEYRIFTVFKDTDAARKGIVPGDALRAIDDAPVAGLDLATILARLRGDPGTEVSLTLENGSGSFVARVLREDLLPEL